jgi:hypothetical protein
MKLEGISAIGFLICSIVFMATKQFNEAFCNIGIALVLTQLTR